MEVETAMPDSVMQRATEDFERSIDRQERILDEVKVLRRRSRFQTVAIVLLAFIMAAVVGGGIALYRVSDQQKSDRDANCLASNTRAAIDRHEMNTIIIPAIVDGIEDGFIALNPDSRDAILAGGEVVQQSTLARISSNGEGTDLDCNRNGVKGDPGDYLPTAPTLPAD